MLEKILLLVRYSLFGLLLLLLPCYSIAANNRKLAKVNTAIDSLRGHDVRNISESEAEKLAQRLDKAWQILTKNASTAMDVIPTVLADEKDDSFLLIDLSYLYVVLQNGDSDAMESAAEWLLRSDPNVYPNAYFNVVSIMGSARCLACIPAVLGLLELEELDAYIPEHALAVDLDLGFLFSIGPYGKAAVDHVVGAFEHPDCVVRKNAVKMATILLEPTVTPAIGKVALQDACLEARTKAWLSLGTLGDTGLGDLIEKRLASGPAVPQEEKLAMITSFESLYWPQNTIALEKFTKDQDSEVSTAASKVINAFGENEENIELLNNASSRSAKGRTQAIDLLNAAISDGTFNFGGTAFELEALLKPDDLPLVNEARASVLRRKSDECIYEWKKLFMAGQLFLQISQGEQLKVSK